MRWHVAGCLPLLALCLQGAGCSSSPAGCRYDTDCPDNQVCVQGQCRDEGDPCQGISCPAGQQCRNGICVKTDPDGGTDAGTDTGSDPGGDPGEGGDDGGTVDPCANVQCPDGQVCQDGICVDQETDADADGWGQSQDCDDQDPQVHPQAPELCNLVDDDCDGATDEDGVCGDCDPGFHDCGGVCMDNTSPDSCGTRCEPCPRPEHATATCQAGQCGFVCDDGFQPFQDGCLDCLTDQACGPECLPCADSESCCEGVCIDTSADPENCGGCGWACPSTDYLCCDGHTCCAPEQNICCGNFCCDSDGTCCPGDYCCPAGGSCCGSYCCAPPHAVCCKEACCADGTTCCNDDFCCTQTHTVCCPEGGGCCPTGSTCCNQHCCPANFPVCCTEVCCQSGNHCCAGGTQCCDKKGRRVPGRRLTAVR